MSNTPAPPLDSAFNERSSQPSQVEERPATTNGLPATQPSRKRLLPMDADESLPFGVAEDEVLLTKGLPTITLLIGQCEVKRLSIDNRCLRNIIFTSTLA